MDTLTRRKGQIFIFIGMFAVAAAGILLRFNLDFLSGFGFGISIPSFFFGFRAFYRK